MMPAIKEETSSNNQFDDGDNSKRKAILKLVTNIILILSFNSVYN
jgi:hypothetical protein